MSQNDIISHLRGDYMRKIELRMNEKEKYDVIKELVNHNDNKYQDFNFLMSFLIN